MSRHDERSASARVHDATAGRIGSHREGDICPVCKQPVETVVKPRKVLGAYVPSYSAGPCHNPRCSANPDRTETAVDVETGNQAGAEAAGKQARDHT